jgi:hypothetical protein
MNSSKRYLSRNRSSTVPMTRFQRPCSAVVGASSTIEECSSSVGRPPCGPSHWRYNCEVRSTSPSISTCLGGCAFRGTQELEKFYLLEFTVNDTCNDRRARWNLSGCRRPGLVSVQSIDQCLRHVLKGSCHPNNNRQLLSVSVQEHARLPGVRPLKRGCYWRHHASSPNTPSSGSATSPNHAYGARTQTTRSKKSLMESTQVNESRSEPQVTGRTGSDTICNNPPWLRTSTQSTGEIFFFSHVYKEQSTHLTLCRHPKTIETRP